VNCVDRHLPERAEQVIVADIANFAELAQIAILWEGDEPGQHRKISYQACQLKQLCAVQFSPVRGLHTKLIPPVQELHREVCKIANALKQKGVRKGDYVTVSRGNARHYK
jgi:acetyl-CoA synthetase